MKKCVWLSVIIFLSMGVCMAGSRTDSPIPVSVEIDLELGSVVFLKYALFDRDGSHAGDPGIEVWSEEMDRQGVVTNLKSVHLLGTLGESVAPISVLDFSNDLYCQVFYRLDSDDPWKPCSSRELVSVPRVGARSAASVGEIRLMAAAASMGDNWLPCDGRILDASEYPALFGIFGARYGGDGLTTFALPDLRGRPSEDDLSGVVYVICTRLNATWRVDHREELRRKGDGGFKRATRLDTHSGLAFTSGGVDYIGLELLEHEDGIGTIWRAIPKNHDLETSPEEIRIVLAPDVVTPI